MNIITILFFVSLMVIVGMISMKSYELRMGKKIWLAFLCRKTDGLVYNVYNRTVRFLSYFNKRSAIALTQWIAYHALSRIRAVYIWIRAKAHAHPPSKKIIDMVRGKGVVIRNGGASFYLKKISEEGVGK